MGKAAANFRPDLPAGAACPRTCAQTTAEDIAAMTQPEPRTLFPRPESEPSSGELFPPPEPRELEHATGILPSQLLRDAIERTHEIRSLAPIADDQIQPASLDLRLGDIAHRARASFLPVPARTV